MTSVRQNLFPDRRSGSSSSSGGNNNNNKGRRKQRKGRVQGTPKQTKTKKRLVNSLKNRLLINKRRRAKGRPVHTKTTCKTGRFPQADGSVKTKRRCHKRWL